MLGNALIFIVQVLFGLLTLTLLLRFYLQWVRAPYRNPLADFVKALTAPPSSAVWNLQPQLFSSWNTSGTHRWWVFIRTLTG